MQVSVVGFGNWVTGHDIRETDNQLQILKRKSKPVLIISMRLKFMGLETQKLSSVSSRFPSSLSHLL